MASSNDKIFLLGDSILDNHYWLSYGQIDLTSQLKKITNREIINLAVDESTTDSILNGIEPRKEYRDTRPYPYLTAEDGKVYPLDLLKDQASKTDYAVLSILGNDFRAEQLSLVSGTDLILRKVLIEKNIKSIYPKIVKSIHDIVPKTILIVCYLPHNSGLYSMVFPTMINLMEKVRTFIYSVGDHYKLPVLDLSKVFDYNDRSYYGTTVIEPSEKSAMVIGRHIKTIVNEHDFNGPSKKYF